MRIRKADSLELALQIVMENQRFRKLYFEKNGRYNRNFNPNRNSNNFNNFHASRQQFSAPAPNNVPSMSQLQQNNSFNRRNSFQYRNNNESNNLQHNNRQASEFRSAFPRHSSVPPQSQQFSNAPRRHYGFSPMPSGSNTDVTMRTASSRRLNYTNDSQQQPMHGNDTNNYDLSNPEQVENFCLAASVVPNE